MKRKLIAITTIVLIILFGICVCYFSKYDSKLVNISDIQTDSEYINVTYDSEDSISDEDIIGILAIEKIGLKASVIDNCETISKR